MRLSLLILALLLTACGSDSSTAQPGSGDGAAALPTGGPVAAVDGERQRLSVAQLMAYLPQEAAGMRYESVAAANAGDGPGAPEADALTWLVLSYRASDHPAAPTVSVTIGDYIDAPVAFADLKRRIDGGMFGSSRNGAEGVSMTEGTASGLATQEIRGMGLGPALRMVIADRFGVELLQDTGAPDVTVEDLVAFVEASGIASLAVAPAYADAGSPEVPEWAASGIARREAQLEESRRRRAEMDAETETARAETVPLRNCDEILPAAEVARVLGVPEVRRGNTNFETEGENCNRAYTARDVRGSIILLISNYAEARLAQGALSVAGDHGDKVGERPLAGLDGRQYTHSLGREMGDDHIAHFAVGTAFIELKAANGLDDSPGATPDQLAELATIVAGNLAP